MLGETGQRNINIHFNSGGLGFSREKASCFLGEICEETENSSDSV